MDIERLVDSGPRPKRCIVIAIDGARRDYLERYEAPWMLKLAEEGVGFRNAIASNGLAETANEFTTIGPQTFSFEESGFRVCRGGLPPCFLENHSFR